MSCLHVQPRDDGLGVMVQGPAATTTVRVRAEPDRARTATGLDDDTMLPGTRSVGALARARRRLLLLLL